MVMYLLATFRDLCPTQSWKCLPRGVEVLFHS